MKKLTVCLVLLFSSCWAQQEVDALSAEGEAKKEEATKEHKKPETPVPPVTNEQEAKDLNSSSSSTSAASTSEKDNEPVVEKAQTAPVIQPPKTVSQQDDTKKKSGTPKDKKSDKNSKKDKPTTEAPQKQEAPPSQEPDTLDSLMASAREGTLTATRVDTFIQQQDVKHLEPALRGYEQELYIIADRTADEPIVPLQKIQSAQAALALVKKGLASSEYGFNTQEVTSLEQRLAAKVS